MAAAPQLTAAELSDHPEYKHVFWDLKPNRKGRLAVGKGRGGPYKIAWELHGDGPNHLVWIMGLGALKSAWQRQTRDLGHGLADKYTCLIFDNRGIGDSDKPIMRYTTSSMAEDVLEILDHVGWTGKRDLHCIGLSMGGMIAQELAYRNPERIASLTLVSTASAIVNTSGWLENLINRASLFIPRSIDVQIANAKANLFTSEWIARPDEGEAVEKPFPTNGDRAGAGELTKRRDADSFPRKGFVCQAIAAGWHYKSPEQLKEIGEKVGRDRIMVIHGNADKLISFLHSEVLLNGLGGEDGGVTKRWVEGQGHGIPIEMRKVFNGWIEDFVAKAVALNEKQVKS